MAAVNCVPVVSLKCTVDDELSIRVGLFDISTERLVNPFNEPVSIENGSPVIRTTLVSVPVGAPVSAIKK